jgi:hypothetical protein
LTPSFENNVWVFFEHNTAEFTRQCSALGGHSTFQLAAQKALANQFKICITPAKRVGTINITAAVKPEVLEPFMLNFKDDTLSAVSRAAAEH